MHERSKLARTQASFHVEGGGPLAVENRELAGSLEYLACLRVRYVAVSCQSAGPASYHPPLPRSPLFQGKRAFWCIIHCLLS